MNGSNFPDKTFKYFLIIILVILIIAHGFEDRLIFNVDNTTVLLLLIICIPILPKYLETIKFGGIEASFKKLSHSKKELFLINEIAKEEKWTYYTPRKNETYSGKALLRLSEKLIEYSPTAFTEMINRQMKSNAENLIWFATENIGYFKLAKFKKDLKKEVGKMNPKIYLPPHKLNILWAYSRFNNYKELIAILNKNTHHYNYRWTLQALIQMMEAHCFSFKADSVDDKSEVSKEMETIQILNKKLAQISEEGTISEELKNRIITVQKENKEILDTLSNNYE